MTEREAASTKAVLTDIEEREGLRIVYGVETGSGAFGWRGPTAHTDVRFYYVRSIADYVRVDLPADRSRERHAGLVRITGWDLREALGLLAQSHTDVLECLGAKHVLREDASIAARMRGIAGRHFSGERCCNAYWSQATSIYRKHLNQERVVPLGYLPAARNLLAIEWIERHETMAPSSMAELAKDSTAGITSKLLELVDDAHAGRGLEATERDAMLDAWIRSEIEACAVKAANYRWHQRRGPERNELDEIIHEALGISTGIAVADSPWRC